jgi:hypothetical protein
VASVLYRAWSETRGPLAGVAVLANSPRALLIGIPIGLAAGRWMWTMFAQQFGILPESVISVATVLLAIADTILLANVMAAVPGRIASRTKSAQVLRAE